MNQPTFADLDYESKKRKTRREKFLERMDGLIPWEELEERIRPFYPQCWPRSASLRVVGDAYGYTACSCFYNPGLRRGRPFQSPFVVSLSNHNWGLRQAQAERQGTTPISNNGKALSPGQALSDPGMEDMLYEVEIGEAVRRAETAWAAAGRDDDSELPPPAGRA